MIKYKVTTLFSPDWENVFSALFPNHQHDYSQIGGNVAVFGFNDQTVTPADLGPLVRVELISE
jgi:hypothetical protein